MAGVTRFEVIKKLGEGGMGVVYEAVDRERNMRVALKTLHKVDPNNLYRFKREFRALSDLSHPNIIALYELVSENDAWYLAMELIEGDDFMGYVRRPNAENIASPSTSVSTPSDVTIDTRVVAPPSGSTTNGKGGLQFMHSVPDEPAAVDDLVDIDRLLDALSQLAQALYALHSQGIIHRDLKPSNVRVTRDGRVVLMDFGIVAETMSEVGAGPKTPLMGTPAYMAPEQATDAPPNASADWYAFGVLIYQALTCRLPFRGPRNQLLEAKRRYDPVPPSTFSAGIPDALESLCMRLIARDPAQRPQGYDVLTALGVAAENISHLMSEVTFIGINEFVGRTHLLQDLGDAFQQCLAHGAVCVVAEGPSGMGKTTLLRRFVYELQATQIGSSSPIFLAGRCHERESLSYKAFDGVIDQLSRELLDLPEHIVASLLPEDIAYLARVFPVLKRVTGVHASRALGQGSLDQQRERAILALRTLLINLGQWRPVVIRIEDLQWADRDSLDLLLAIMRPPLPQRLFLLTSLRTDVEVRSDNSGFSLEQALSQLAEQVICHRVGVGPLSYNEQVLLVAKLAGERNLPTDIDEAYWSEAEGNPLLLAELARYATEAPEELRTAARPRLGDIIALRIARLPAKARVLLEILAVAGEPMPLWLLAECVGLTDDERERASSTLRVAKLARIALPGHEPWLNAQHDKISDTVLAQISVEKRRSLHRSLAQGLQRWDAAAVPSLARHWLAADERGQAIEYLFSSAQAATDKLAFDRAAELYRALLELHDDPTMARRLSVAKSLANVLVLGGRYGEAADVYAQATKYASQEEALELSRLGAENLLRSGRVEEGIAQLETLMNQLGIPLKRSRGGKLMKMALSRAKRAFIGLRYTPRVEREIPARDLGRIDTLYVAATSLAMIDHRMGALVQAQHLESALQAGEESRICRALAIEVSYLGALGGKDASRAVQLLRDVRRRAEALDTPLLMALYHMGEGINAFFAYRMRAAVQALENSLRVLEQVVGAQWEHTTVQFFHALARLHMGDWRPLIGEFAPIIERAERRGDVYALNLFKSQPSAWHWLARDQIGHAHHIIDGALTGWSSESYYIAHCHAHLARAVVHLYAGEGEKAASVLDRVEGELDNLMLDEMPLVVAQLASYRGRAALLMGDEAGVRKAIKRLSRVDSTVARALAMLLEAPLAIEQSDTEEAERLVEEALDIFAEHGAAHMVAACEYRLGELTGGSQRDELVERAMTWMRQQEVTVPEKMVALLTWRGHR